LLSASSILTNNFSADSGGGLSVKSGSAVLNGPVSITANIANGDGNYGNGGGVYVTTSYYDRSVGFEAATLFGSDGNITSTNAGVVVESNDAGGFGGGFYGGSDSGFTQSHINLTNILCRFNTASGLVTNGSIVLLPTQVAVENINSLVGDATDPIFDSATITGNSATTDIGIYVYGISCLTPSTNSTTFTYGSLAFNMLP
jgi:hypothetical protein